MATAERHLFHNPAPAVSDAWPLIHPALASLLWSAAILAAPLAVRRYRRLAG